MMYSYITGKGEKNFFRKKFILPGGLFCKSGKSVYSENTADRPG